MRGLINFDVGELITIDGKQVKFDGVVPPLGPRADGTDDLQFVDARNRRAITFTPDDFLAAYTGGRVRYHRAPQAAGDVVGDDEEPGRRIARKWRLFWTTAYDKSPVPKSTAKLLAFIVENRGQQPDPVDPPSPHTLRRWLRDRGEQDSRRPRQMGDRRHSRVCRKPVHDFVQSAFETASRKYWLNYRVTFEDVQIEVRAAVANENARRVAEGVGRMKLPGRTTLWRWLRQERTYDNIRSREGRHVADRQFKAIRNSLSAKRIMDVAVIDHKRMDVHLCDASRRFTIGRPWLAILIDVKSRMVIGYSLTFEDPSVLSLMACVRSAMRGQPEMKKRFPSIDGEWEAFGMPRTILADNAWENIGSSFEDACADSGISVEWAPVKRPEYKGIVERFFSRLDDQLVHKLPGAVVDNPFVLAERRIDPRSDASVTLSELEEFLCRYIVDVYSSDLHVGIDSHPLKVWRDGAKHEGIELAHDLAAVEHAMGKLVRDRSLNHEGVTFQGLVYRSGAVDALLTDLLPLQAAGVRAGTARVKIKYHPEDLSRIFVWNEARNTYVPLPCIEENYARGLSERVHAEIRIQKREDGEAFISKDERCQKKARLLQSIQQSYDKQPQSERRRRARMLGSGAQAVTETVQQPEIIAVDAVSNRVDGDKPEKASVRSRKAKKLSLAQPPKGSLAEYEMFDPFADRDRDIEIERSLERLA